MANNPFRAFQAANLSDLRRSVQLGIGRLVTQLNAERQEDRGTIIRKVEEGISPFPTTPSNGVEVYLAVPSIAPVYSVGWYKYTDYIPTGSTTPIGWLKIT